MTRTVGSIGLVKREFETDFYAYCSDNDVSIGRGFGMFMEDAIKSRDSRTFTQLLAVGSRYFVDPVEAAQTNMVLVVDRASEPKGETPKVIEHTASAVDAEPCYPD